MAGQYSRGLMKFPKVSSLTTSALFLFFLIYSPPHQVHHFFDQHNASHHSSTVDQDRHGDHHKPDPQDTTCVFQTVAKTCHANLGSAIHTFAVPLVIEKLFPPIKASIFSSFLRGAFQIRAPPKT
jgi:hypothetical protein